MSSDLRPFRAGVIVTAALVSIFFFHDFSHAAKLTYTV
ncbi:MAG: hypothetical protein H6Q78_459, partial [Candidatus Krumholzibacteriota bacterium]|nr:hypothetical protein [Candidatus Krumholzibacteriota bacterium]